MKKETELKLKKIEIRVAGTGKHILTPILKLFKKETTGVVVVLQIRGIYENGFKENFEDFSLIRGDVVEIEIKKQEDLLKQK